MTDVHPGERPVDPARPRNSDPATRLIVVLIVLVVVAVGVAIGVSVLPGWWLDRVAAVADGNRLVGTFAGLTCGVVFTAIPLLLVRLVVGRRRLGGGSRGGSRGGPRWRRRALWLLLAVGFALPNLATAAIAVDTGRTLSGVAPGFGGGTLVGALLGALAVIVIWVLLADRRRTAQELARLRGAARVDPSAPVDPSLPVDKSAPVDKSDAD